MPELKISSTGQVHTAKAASGIKLRLPNNRISCTMTSFSLPPDPHRHALVIGMTAYAEDPLPNAASDARLIYETLKKRSFNSTLKLDLSGVDLEAALKSWGAGLPAEGVAIIYFAGHGLELRGAGYVYPIDVQPVGSLASAVHQGMAVDDIVRAMGVPDIKKILILDICRETMLEDGSVGGFGDHLNDQRNRQASWSNLMIAYSTSAGELAKDGPEGGNSLFSSTLAEAMLAHDLSLEACLHHTVGAVISATGASQRPWSYSTLSGRLALSDVPRLVQTAAHPIIPQNHDPRLAAHRGASRAVVSNGSRASWIVTADEAYPDGVSLEPIVFASESLGGRRASMSEDGRILITGPDSVAQMRMAFNSGRPNSARLSSNGEVLMCLGNDAIEVFDVSGPAAVSLYRDDSVEAVTEGVFLSDRDVLIGGGQGWFRRVELRAEGPVSKDFKIGCDHIYEMAVGPGGLVVCGASSGRVHVVDPGTGSGVQTYYLPREVRSPEARFQSLRSDGGLGMLLTSDTWPAGRKPRPGEARIFNHILSCAWLDPLPLVVVGGYEGLVHVIDVRDGQLVQTIDVDGAGRQLAGLTALKDGSVLTLNQDGVVKVYRLMES